MSKLVLIDSNAILHRAYHALPKTFRTKKGEPINAVYGFVSMLLRIIADLKPTHIACAFDLKEPTFRKKEFADYQAHRPEMDKDLDCQFDKAKDVVASFGIPIYERAGFEADDVIGTIAEQVQSAGVDDVVIITGDKDILQLVTERVKVYLPVKGLSQAQLVGPKEVYEKMGVRPDQVDEYKALVGDPSDNYKGVPGIGPKTAEKLLAKYKDLDEIYGNLDEIDKRTVKKLVKGEKSARQSQRLAQIVTDVDIDFDVKDTVKWNVGNKETLDLFAEYGFRTLSKRVREFGGVNDDKLTPRRNLSKEEVEKSVAKIGKFLKGKKYAIRGTASLVMQGIEMKVDDIDIVADKETALACNRIFKNFLVKKVSLSSSEKYKSYFGEFNIDGIKVEVMGEWQIRKDQKTKNKEQEWGRKYNASENQVIQVKVGKRKVKLTTIEMELAMFAGMGRWNAYHKIKKQLEEKNQQRLF
jgi:DNA polymerase-1